MYKKITNKNILYKKINKIKFKKRKKGTVRLHRLKKKKRDFPGGTVVKNLPANAGDTGSIPGPGRSHMPRCN